MAAITVNLSFPTVVTICYLIVCFAWWIKVDPLNWKGGDYSNAQVYGCGWLLIGWLVSTLVYAGFWIGYLIWR